MPDDMSTTKYIKRTQDNPWAEWVSEDVTDEVAALRERIDAELRHQDRILLDMQEAKDEVATLRAKLSERRTHIVNGITRNSRQRQANARIQRQYEAMRAERDAETRRADDNYDAMKRAEDDVKRLLTANDMLEAVIKDAYEKRDGETCGRAQCRNATNAIRAERDSYAFEMRNERARADITEAEVERMRPVVEAAIAVIETDKRLYHGSAEHAEAEAEAAFTALDEAVEAYRAAQQETNDA